MAGAAGVYGLLLFLPIVLRLGLGYSQTKSFLLAAPPAAVAVIFFFLVSIISDKYRVRGPFVLLEGSLGIIGLCMIGFLDHPTPRYVGSFLGSCGCNGLIVTVASWQQNNIREDAKRSILAAIQVSSAGIGGIYSALVFRQQVRIGTTSIVCTRLILDHRIRQILYPASLHAVHLWDFRCC